MSNTNWGMVSAIVGIVGLIVMILVDWDKIVSRVQNIPGLNWLATWTGRIVKAFKRHWKTFGLLLGVLILEYIRSQLSLWTVALFVLQLLLLLGLIFQILASERETEVATSRPQTFIYREEFREDFQYNLENWDYSGDWSVERKDDQNVLIVTKSGSGGIAKPCLSWTDYVFEFETKIANRNTSWVIRAKDTGSYVMLQCQQERLYPHFRVDGKWPNRDWTKQNPVILPTRLPLDTWFAVRIEVRGIQIVVTVTVNGREMEILNRPLLESPPAPVSYPMGSVGFRESAIECAHFRNVRVKRL